jgi:hypothetical protein
MIAVLTFAALLCSITVDVSLPNGEVVSGQIESLTQDGISISDASGKQRQFSRSNLTSIQSKEASETNNRQSYAQWADGSLTPFQSVRMTNGEVQVKNGLGSEWKASAKALSAIRWLNPNETDVQQWDEIQAKAGSEDLLVIRRQSLDYLKGVVTGVSETTVQFEYSGNTIPVPLAKVAGIILAKQAAELPAARLKLTSAGGGQWLLREAQLRNEQLLVKTVAGVSASLPLKDLVSITFPQLGAVYLTDIEPTTATVTPYFGSVLSDTLESLYAPQFDHDKLGRPLRISSKASASGWVEFERGIAAHSRTELVYRLAGRYQRFMSTAGFAFGTTSQANVELKLFADDEEIFSQSIDHSEEPLSIDVDVSGARRLRLLVDYGANADIGDQLHLGDARLIK